MGLIQDISLGLRSYTGALRFVIKNKMWPYFIIPIIVFGVIIYLGFQMEAGEKEAKAALADSNFFYMIWGWIKIAFYFVMSYLFLQLTRYVMLTALSPLLSIVSEKVEKILTGNTYKFNLKQLIKDVKRALLIATRNSFLDYVMERRRLTIKESIKFVRKHKGVAIALGSLFVGLFHSIEIVKEFDAGVGRTIFMWVTALLAASIPIFTAIAATLSMHELIDLSSNEFAVKNGKAITEDRTNAADLESLPEDL